MNGEGGASGSVGERVGSLWQTGEELSLHGEHGDALLLFQRAKSLLLAEGKAAGAQNPGVTKVLAQIMQKLSLSIERDVAILDKNPVHALGLSRGFTKADIKRAYRKSALKFHPDKNSDCDSSCIFAAIQSSYEKLNATLDDNAPAQRQSSGQPPASFSSAKPPAYEFKTFQERELARQQSDASRKQKQTYKEKEQERKREREYAREKSSAAAQDSSASSGAASSSGPGSVGGGESVFRQEASYLSEMPTAALRKLLKQFGFGDMVDLMSREELIKKYLAVSAHLENKKRASNTMEHIPGAKAAPVGGKVKRQSAYRGAPESARSFKVEESELFDDHLSSASATAAFVAGLGVPTAAGPASGKGGKVGDRVIDEFEDLAKRWAKEWASEMRAEFDREQSRKTNLRQQYAEQQYTRFPSQQQQRGPNPSPYAPQAPPQPSSARRTTLEDDAERRRRSVADVLRKERLAWLTVQLPLMTVAELRRLLITTGLSLDGLDNRERLVERLCKHFGVKKEDLQGQVNTEEEAGSRGEKVNAQVEDKSIAATATLGNKRRNTSMTPAEAAMNAKLHFADKDPLEAFKRPAAPNNLPPVTPMPNPLLPGRMDTELLKKVVSLDPFGSSSTGNPSGGGKHKAFVTKERLEQVEKKLGGGRRRSRPQVSSGVNADEPSARSSRPVSSENETSRVSNSETFQLSAADERVHEKRSEAVDDEDDGIDSDLDYIEQLRMSRWKISELEIPAATGDDFGEIKNVRMAGRALLESEDEDDDDYDDDDDDHDENVEEIMSYNQAGAVKSASPASGGVAWSNTSGAAVTSSKKAFPVPRISLGSLQNAVRGGSLEDEEDDDELAALAAPEAGQSETSHGTQGRLVGRLRPPRAEPGLQGGTATFAGASKQRSPQQAAELQEEVDFWVHSPRGATYQDMSSTASATAAAAAAAAATARAEPPVTGFIFFG